jgi:hypothetical protein
MAITTHKCIDKALEILKSGPSTFVKSEPDFRVTSVYYYFSEVMAKSGVSS